MDTYCYGPGHTDPDCKIDLKFNTEIKPVVGGTRDYTKLENKPRVNGVELVGDKSDAELLILPISNAEIEQLLKAFA